MAQISVDITKLKDRDSATAIDYLAGLFETKTIVKITNKTSSYTATEEDSGSSFNNSGATSAVHIRLPAASAGLTFCGLVATAQEFQFSASGLDLIYSGPIVSSTSGYINSSTPFSYIQLECHIDGNWIVTFLTGSWTIG